LAAPAPENSPSPPSSTEESNCCSGLTIVLLDADAVRLASRVDKS